MEHRHTAGRGLVEFLGSLLNKQNISEHHFSTVHYLLLLFFKYFVFSNNDNVINYDHALRNEQ